MKAGQVFDDEVKNNIELQRPPVVRAIPSVAVKLMRNKVSTPPLKARIETSMYRD
jgi:hypothetical protein